MNRFFVQDGILTVENDLFSTTFSGVSSASSRPVTDCLSVPYLEITAEKIDGSQGCYCLWEDLPVVRMPEYREETLLTLEGEHWIVRNIKLAAFTDENDTLTEEGRALRDRASGIPEKVSGCVKLEAEEALQLYQLLYKVLDAFRA